MHPLINKIPVLKKEDRIGQRSAQNCYNYVNVSLAVAGKYFEITQVEFGADSGRPSLVAVVQNPWSPDIGGEGDILDACRHTFSVRISLCSGRGVFSLVSDVGSTSVECNRVQPRIMIKSLVRTTFLLQDPIASPIFFYFLLPHQL